MTDPSSNSNISEEGSWTSRLNESFSGASASTTRHQSNLSSIVNLPQSKTTQVMEGIVNMITETRIYKQIEDQSQKLFYGASGSVSSPQSQPLTEETLSRISIDVSAFQQYRMRITGELSQYLRQKRMDAETIDVLSTIDLNQVLLRCFREVPAQYFDANYHFDMKSHASRDVNKMNEVQEELAGHLDEVEINLFYQISHRFDEFLAVILELNSMQQLIDECLEKIAFIRQRNLVLKQKLAAKGSGIVQIKKRILRAQSVLALLQLTATLHKSLPFIHSLINEGKFDLAVTLLHQTETHYNQKFTKMLALNPLKESIFIYRAKLEKNIATSFMDKQLDYVISELNFTKNPQISRNSSKNSDSSLDESSLLNSTINNEVLDASNDGAANLTVLQSNQRLTHLHWQHSAFHREIDLEEHIARIINQSYDLDKFLNQAYRRKLIEMLKGFREGFLNDMRDYDQSAYLTADVLSEIADKKPNNAVQSSGLPFEKMNIDLFLNFSLFYCEILRRVALKQMGLNQTLLTSLISHVIRQLEASGKDLDDNINAFSKLSTTIEDVFQNVIQLFKYINDWVDHLLKQRRLDDEVSITHFRKLSGIFDFWTDFIKNEASSLCRISAPASAMNSKELKKILKKFTDYHEKISMKTLETLRAELEKKFLDNFHKNSLTSIKAAIDADRWASADVPFEFFDIIRYITTPVMTTKHSSSTAAKTSHSNPSEIISDDEDDETHHIKMNENSDNNNNQDQIQLQVRILKNSIALGKSTYKVSGSLLSLLKVVYEYVKVMEHFPAMRQSACTKLNELLRFYNQYVRKLVIQRGAGWEINSKHLGLSAVCLFFMLSMIAHLQKKISSFASDLASGVDAEFIEMTFGKTSEEIDSHAKTITKAITTILNEELKKYASALNELAWNSSKENLKTPTQQTVSVLKSFRMLYEVLQEFFEKEVIAGIYDSPLDGVLKTYLKVLNTVPITNKLGAKRINDEALYIMNQIKAQEYAKHKTEYLKQLQTAVEGIVAERCTPLLEVADSNSNVNDLWNASPKNE